MDINYELYKVFYYVALSLSFSEASKHLFISQSAVSQSIKTLERKLDQKLFIRSTKRVQLTPEGEILLRHIEPAMNLIQRGEAQLTDAAKTGGQIRIGASDTICRYFLVPYLERFHKEFPHVHIKVLNQTSIRCVELLETGQVDLIVVNYPNSYLSNVSSIKKIRTFRDIFIANQAFSELKDRKLSFIPDYCLKEVSSDLFEVKTQETLPERELVVAYSEQIPVSKATQAFLNYF